MKISINVTREVEKSDHGYPQKVTESVVDIDGMEGHPQVIASLLRGVADQIYFGQPQITAGTISTGTIKAW